MGFIVSEAHMIIRAKHAHTNIKIHMCLYAHVHASTYVYVYMYQSCGYASLKKKKAYIEKQNS